VTLQPGTLRLAGGLGALLVCGGAGASVAADQRPAGAPLRPPVSNPSAPVAAAAAPGGLVIPPTPVCSGGTTAARAAAPVAAPPAATDPQLAAVLAQIAQAPAPAARRQLIAALPADQRQQVTALMRQRTPVAAAKRKPVAGARAGGGASCLAGGGGSGSGRAIAPSVSDAGTSGPPVTFTYVS
jgi:hypothetical protein